jgi:hypothetical protein
VVTRRFRPKVNKKASTSVENLNLKLAIRDKSLLPDMADFPWLRRRRALIVDINLHLLDVSQLAHLLHRDFILEVVRIEWIDSSLCRFRLRIHEINERLFGGTWQRYVVRVVICHPIHLP